MDQWVTQFNNIDPVSTLIPRAVRIPILILTIYVPVNSTKGSNKKRVNKKEIVDFKKGIGIERCTQFTTVTLIMKKVPKQDEQVNLLHI